MRRCRGTIFLFLPHTDIAPRDTLPDYQASGLDVLDILCNQIRARLFAMAGLDPGQMGRVVYARLYAYRAAGLWATEN